MREKKKSGLLNTGSADCGRRVPFDFTACLAHVEIIERTSNREISWVTGDFTHNELCRSAILKRLPAVPLHEHVYEVALGQLESGARYVP